MGKSNEVGIDSVWSKINSVLDDGERIAFNGWRVSIYEKVGKLREKVLALPDTEQSADIRKGVDCVRDVVCDVPFLSK